ncbi:MAG: NUMOD4 domain-containing protein [Bacteroidales bacterium]
MAKKSTMDLYPNEQWKKLVHPELHPEEHYLISNYGRIKSFKRNPIHGEFINGGKLKGYNCLSVKLSNGRRTTRYIHKLVAELFSPKEDSAQTFVIHLDYDKSNNHVDNLRWVTKPTMFAHQKLNPNYVKKRMYNAKLTENQVVRLKKMLKHNDKKLYRIAEEFGITHTQLNRIRSGENWGHIKVD